MQATTRIGWIAGAAAVALAVLAAASLRVIEPGRQAIVLRFGRPIHMAETGGIIAAIPIVDRVVVLDRSSQTFGGRTVEVVAADGGRLMVDPFMRLRIVDPLSFHAALGDPRRASGQLSAMLDAGVRQALGTAPVRVIVVGDRGPLMRAARQAVAREAAAARLGVEIEDVRLRRVDLTPEDAAAVDQRMAALRMQTADDLRAAGEQQRRVVMAQADAEAASIRAEANAEAEAIRGDGDAQRAKILAATYGRDPAFAKFYRTLQAYEGALGSGATTFVLSPDSSFLQILEHGPGGSK